jgi:hypothetical protein
MESNIITASRLKCFNQCRRKHHIKYVLGYRSRAKSEALEFGTLIHKGLEIWWKTGGNLDEMLNTVNACQFMDPIQLIKARVLLKGYHARWVDDLDRYKVLFVEKEFTHKITNPATMRPCIGLSVDGKMDVVVEDRRTGENPFIEHKTSSEDLSPGSTYWDRNRMDPQVSIYYGGMESLGYTPEGCIYDVIGKFGERPYKATPMDKRKYKKDGTLYANQRESDETLEEFEARLTELVAADPNAYYGRANVVRTQKEIEESMRDVHAVATMMRDEERLQRAPRNPDACFLYNRQCEFYGVCAGYESLDDETKYEKLETMHPELGLKE